jgi:hypothetical protein
MLYSKLVKPAGVAARPRQAVHKSRADRIRDDHEDDRNRTRSLQDRRHARSARGQDDVGRKRHQFHCIFLERSDLLAAQRYSICTFRPSIQPRACSRGKSLGARNRYWIVRSQIHQDADAPNAFAAAPAPPLAKLLPHPIRNSRRRKSTRFRTTHRTGPNQPSGRGTARAGATENRPLNRSCAVRFSRSGPERQTTRWVKKQTCAAQKGMSALCHQRTLNA